MLQAFSLFSKLVENVQQYYAASVQHNTAVTEELSVQVKAKTLL